MGSVFVLERLTDENISEILDRAVRRMAPGTSESSHTEPDENHVPQFPRITPKVLKSIIALSSGDARTALSLLEIAITASEDVTETSLLENLKRSVVARQVTYLRVVCCPLFIVFRCVQVRPHGGRPLRYD